MEWKLMISYMALILIFGLAGILYSSVLQFLLMSVGIEESYQIWVIPFAGGVGVILGGISLLMGNWMYYVTGE